MRRQVENSTKDTIGAIAFTLFWIIALTALSASAHGLEKTSKAPAQPQTQIATAAVTDEPVTKTPAAGNGESDDQKDEETETLSRFILISIADRKIALIDNGEVVKVYPIAVGKDETPSPTGEFTVINHAVNPTYSHEGKIVPPGPDNPVGTRWMGLSLKGYGIHGTNVQSSIGKAASHGCFRMKKKDVEELYSLVKVGDTVIVRGERDELVSQVFGTGTRTAETKVAANDNSSEAAVATGAGGQQ